MKIRVYSPFVPVPVSEGAHQVIADQVRFLAKHHHVELVTWLPRPTDEDFPLSSLGRSLAWRKLSWSNHRRPSGSRWQRVLRALILGLASPEMFYYPTPRPDLAGTDVDLEIFHYSFSYNWIKDGLTHRAQKRVVYYHNLESDLFKARVDSEKLALAKAICALNADRLRSHEKKLLSLVDEAWMISSVDAKSLALLEPGKASKVVVRPPTFELSDFFQSKRFEIKRSSETSIRFGFIGGLDFYPNFLSLDWLGRKVFPMLIENGFTGQIVAAGKPSTFGLVSNANAKFFKQLGFLQDPEDFWRQVDCTLVPHVSGSGVRMKLLESLARGIPVIANSAAMDRIDSKLKNSPVVVLANKPEEWVQAMQSFGARAISSPQELANAHQCMSAESVYRDLI